MKRVPRRWAWLALALAVAAALAAVFVAYLQPGLLLDFSNLLSCG